MDPDQKAVCSIIEKVVKSDREERVTTVLRSALGLKNREVISLAGAGGKTTLMFRLARELFLEGKKVITTTTTKIFEPASGETAFLFIHPREEEIRKFVGQHINEYRHLTIASERLGSGKLKGISSDLVDSLWGLKEIDFIIVEADGAAGRPVKAPRQGEPVIPSVTTLVVAILGVDGLGMKVNGENMFQAERVSRLTGIPEGSEMTEEGMAVLMTHPEGIFKGAPSSSRVIAFLNKVDIPDGAAKGRGVAQKIIERREPRIERIVLGQLRSEAAVSEVIFP
ncbi:MAG: putative selenium-dependent hydroxylase accessory protein YqeC [Syntrophaceae bacterium]|nr:putative selenium-dependent hydroxylase accessory protein YqeC [Syntrophaceae bacterium]